MYHRAHNLVSLSFLFTTAVYGSGVSVFLVAVGPVDFALAFLADTVATAYVQSTLTAII